MSLFRRGAGKVRTFDADRRSLPDVQRFVDGCLDGTAVTEDLRIRIAIVAEEVFLNIADNAYGGEKGDVKIRCEVVDGLLVLEFSDRGVPFDPTERPEPDLTVPMDERPIGGLGIHIVRNSMDSMEYRREGDTNILTLEKRLS